MRNNVYVPLLGAAALVYAWGPLTHAMDVRGAHHSLHDTVRNASHTLNTAVAAKSHVRKSRNEAQPVSLDPAVDVKVSRDVSFAMRVRNAGDKRVELTFPTAQTHEFTVRDSSGRTVWKWSDGRMFTQTLQTKVVDARDTMMFEGTWEAPHSGAYTVLATLASGNHPVEMRAAFRVP